MWPRGGNCPPSFCQDGARDSFKVYKKIGEGKGGGEQIFREVLEDDLSISISASSLSP